MKLVTLHYLSAAIIVSIYGVQVCPFLESLTWGQLVLPILAAFALQFSLQQVLWPHLVGQADFELQSRRAFALVLGLFLFSGLGLSLFNQWFYQFPLGSGAKLTVGLLGLGLFCAVDISLAEERRLHRRFAHTGETLNPERHFFSQPKKLALLALALALCMAGVFFLLIVKDLDWMIEVGGKINLKDAQRAILAEVLFVVLVALGHFCNLIQSYSQNQKLFFTHENQALSGAGLGDFGNRVPVASADEYGQMAQRTNEMIRHLARRTQEVAQTQDATIVALASLAETRDNETGAHIRRTQEYVKAIALKLKNHPDFSADLTPEVIDLFYKSAPLHDIGKVGIPDAILLKPERLDEPEFRIMMTHARLGEQALEEPLAQLGECGFLRYAQ